MAAMLAIWGVLVISGLSLQIRKADPTTAEGDMGRQISYGLIYLALVLSSRFYWRPRILIDLPVTLLLTFVWFAISLSWSLAPDIAVRRLILTFMLTFAAFRITDTLGYARTAGLLRMIFVVLLAGCFLAIPLLPSAIHHLGERADALAGNWRGILPHKNIASQLCVLTILSFVFTAPRWSPQARVAIIVAAAFFLWKTSSETSLLMCLAGLACGTLFLFYNYNLRALLLPLGMIAITVICVVISQYGEEFTRPIGGDDPSVLTGRVVIWSVLLDYMHDNPLGAGFGSFWNIGDEGPVYQYATNWVTGLGNGHNGYLDLIVTVGVPGMLLAVTATIIAPIGRLLTTHGIPRADAAWLVSIITFDAGLNMSETTMFDRDAFMQIMAMFTIALVRSRARQSAAEDRAAQILSGQKQKATDTDPDEPTFLQPADWNKP